MKIWNTKSGYRIVQLLSGRSNVFLLSNKEKNILIDTGPSFMRKTLEKRLRSLDIKNIDLLILTHCHFDHAANANWIKKYYKASVMLHTNEAEYLLNGQNVLILGIMWYSRIIVSLFAKRFLTMAKYEPCKPEILVESSYDLKEYDFNASVIHTPGHTCGSVSIIIDNEVALVGDTMFGIFRGSVFPPFANDVIQMIASWGKLFKTDCKVYIPSHGTANSRELVKKEYDKWKLKSKEKIPDTQ